MYTKIYKTNKNHGDSTKIWGGKSEYMEHGIFRALKLFRMIL